MYERPYLKQVKGKIEEPRRFIHMADAGLGKRLFELYCLLVLGPFFAILKEIRHLCIPQKRH